MVVFGVVFVSWSPHMVVNVVHDVGVELPRSTRVWVTSLGLFNSAMNFFVYLLLNRQFRKALPFRSCHRCSGSRSVTAGLNAVSVGSASRGGGVTIEIW